MAGECDFCDRLDRRQQDRPWYDFHIVDETDLFVTVACMGAFVPGYVLIVPRRHVFAMASLPASELGELARYEDGISRKLAGHWKHPVLFEHGSCAAPDVATGACISHAHWHLVPGDYDLGAHSLVFTQALSFDALGVADRSNGYLMYRRRSSWFYNLDTKPPSQYFRRIIAAQSGCPDEWDYLAFPHLDNMRSTILGLTGADPLPVPA